MVTNYDLSDLGGNPAHDLSDLGGTRIHQPPTRQKLDEFFTPSKHDHSPQALMQLLGDIPYALAKTGRGVANAILPTSLQNLKTPEDIFPHGKGTIDSLVQGAASYAPFAAAAPEFALAKGASMLPRAAAFIGENAIPGAAFGASQAASEGRPIGQEAGIGAATNVGAALIPKSIQVGADKIKDALTRYAGKGLSGRIESFMKNPSLIDNQAAHGLAESELKSMKGEEKSAWDSLSDMASTADKGAKEIAPGYTTSTFDSKEYEATIRDKLEQLRKESKQESGYELRNKPAIKFAEGLLSKKMPSNFEDAIRHAKSLNEHFRREMDVGEGIPYETINYALHHFNRAIDKNINEQGMKNTLGEAWDKANALTKEKHHTFNEIPSPSGTLDESRFKKMRNEDNDSLDKGTFIKDYLPKKNENSVGRMSTLGKMLGDEQLAKDLIKKNYFQDAFKNKELDPSSFVNKYQNLDDANKAHLFTPQDRTTIEALSTILRKHPEMLKNDTRTLIQKHSLMATLGALVGIHFGHEFAGMLGGVTLQNLSNKALSSLLSNPKYSTRAAERLTRPKYQLSKNISDSLRKTSQGALTPGITNFLGGQ